MSVLRASLMGVCLIFVAVGASAERIERNYHETFDVKSGDKLHLDFGDGDVVIEPWDENKLDVVVRYDAEQKTIGVGRNESFEVDFRQSGSTVHVIGREGGTAGIGFFHHRVHEHVYEVRAPAHLILDLEGEDGDVEIEGWEGEISIRAEDGDVELTGIESPSTDLQIEDGDVSIDRLSGQLKFSGEDGDLRVSDCSLADGRIRLEDGDATFSRCEGSARFDLDDGNLALERFRPDGIQVRTEDGDVELDFLASSAMDVEVRTGDGDVFVDLASDSSASFRVDTGDGGIRIDMPSAVDVSKRSSKASGQLGSGDGRLQIETDDGTVVLREGR
jgi:hypothetical protein